MWGGARDDTGKVAPSCTALCTGDECVERTWRGGAGLAVDFVSNERREVERRGQSAERWLCLCVGVINPWGGQLVYVWTKGAHRVVAGVCIAVFGVTSRVWDHTVTYAQQTTHSCPLTTVLERAHTLEHQHHLPCHSHRHAPSLQAIASRIPARRLQRPLPRPAALLPALQPLPSSNPHASTAESSALA